MAGLSEHEGGENDAFKVRNCNFKKINTDLTSVEEKKNAAIFVQMFWKNKVYRH